MGVPVIGHQDTRTEHKPTVGSIKLFKKDVNEETFSANLKDVHLPTLNLRACQLKYAIWEDLSSREIQIDELKLDNTNLRENVHGLPKCLVSAQVKKLSLVNTKLKTENFKTFLKELSSEKNQKITLDSVNLMHVEIDTEGFEVLAKILNLLPSDVQELNVTNCGLTDEAIDTFYQTLSTNRVIHKLALGQTDQITPNGMKTIGKLAEKCHVKKLDLAVCYLSDEHLAKAEESLPDSIEFLNLRENTRLSVNAIISLALKWKTLNEIDVRDAWFEQQELEILVEVLLTRKGIGDNFENEDIEQIGEQSVGEIIDIVNAYEAPEKPPMKTRWNRSVSSPNIPVFCN